MTDDLSSHQAKRAKEYETELKSLRKANGELSREQTTRLMPETRYNPLSGYTLEILTNIGAAVREVDRQ
jgi:hypothetical protein